MMPYFEPGGFNVYAELLGYILKFLFKIKVETLIQCKWSLPKRGIWTQSQTQTMTV
jgi:hypothetical protein